MKRECIALIMLAALCAHGSGFLLLKDGKPSAGIIAPPSVKKTVDFFNSEFKKSSGTTLSAANANVIEIKLKPSKYIDRSKFTITFPSEKIMRIEGTEISIRFALNHILHAVGIRYPMPGPFGGHYPKITDFSLPQKTVSKDAAFRLFRNMYADNDDWALSLNAIPQDSYEFINHGIASLFPIAEYSQEKWKDSVWPLVNGQRKKPVQYVWEPCYSSETTVDEAVKRICSMLERNPAGRTVSLCHNDGLDQFCKCDKCAALDSRANPAVEKLRKHPFKFRKHYSESFCAWANKVAERVLKKYPDVYFGISSYNETLLPPTFKLNDRILALFCFESFALTDDGVRRFWDELIGEWSKKAALTGVWEYGYGLPCFTLPKVCFKQSARALKFLKAHNAECVFIEGFPSFGEGPKRYLYMRHSWDAKLNCEAVLKDWHEACVGKQAAPHLGAYYDFWDEYWTKRAVKTSWFNESKFATYTAMIPDGGYIYKLEKGDFAKLRKLMERVVSNAEKYGDANQKKRAEALMLEFEFYEASAYMNAAEIIPDAGISKKPEALELAGDIPRIIKYALKRPAAAKKMLASFPPEAWGGKYKYMRKNFERKFADVKFPEAITNLNAWLSDADVKRIYSAQISDPATPVKFKKMLAFLLDLGSGKIPNIVPDPSFENGKGKWTACGGVSEKYAASGKKSLEFTMPRQGKGEIVLRVLMTARKKYMLTAKVYLEGDYPPERATGYGYILGINKLNVGSNYYVPFKTPLVPGKWNAISTTADVGPCDGKGDIYICINGMEKGEKVYIDDVSFVELKEK